MSTEDRVSNSYIRYVEKVSTSDFALDQSLRENTMVLDRFRNEVVANPDLMFFTATLWQMYVLKEKEYWAHQADNYLKELEKVIRQNSYVNGELLQSVYLLPYQLNPNKELLDIIVESLSQHISAYDIKIGQRNVIKKHYLELLLENKIMFFATKETGDPVFGNFASENSSILFEDYFRKDLRLMSVLTNDVSEKNLAKLQTEDFYKLALGIRGFYELYKETGIEDYLTFSKAIATVFKTVLLNSKIDTKIVNRIDLISQSLVSLALLDMSEKIDDSYEVASVKIYENILHQIEKANLSEDNVNGEKTSLHNESFRQYYYLFEYELRKQDLI